MAGHSATRATLRRAAEWTIVHPGALAGLSAALPVVSRAAIRLVASQVVTEAAEAAEAADKSQDKLPYEEDHLILFPFLKIEGEEILLLLIEQSWPSSEKLRQER